MKKYEITEDKIQKIAQVLLEIPAKHSLDSLDILRNLPIIEDKKE